MHKGQVYCTGGDLLLPTDQNSHENFDQQHSVHWHRPPSVCIHPASDVGLVTLVWAESEPDNLSLSMYIGRTHWMLKVFKKACEKYSSRRARCFGRTRLTSACISCVGTIYEYTNMHELNCIMCEAQNKNHMKYESLERDCGHSVPVKMRKFSAMHLGAFPHCPALVCTEVWNTRSPGAPTSSLASQTPNPPDPNPPCWSLIASNTVSIKKCDKYPSSILRGEAHRNASEVYSGMRLTASRQERYWNHILWCITDGIITDNHDLILVSFFIFVDFNLWKRFPVLIPCFQLQFFFSCVTLGKRPPWLNYNYIEALNAALAIFHLPGQVVLVVLDADFTPLGSFTTTWCPAPPGSSTYSCHHKTIFTRSS